jgi:hypothetical protein
VDLERCYELLADVNARHGIGPIESLREEEMMAVLDLARVVAHSVERKAAPLISFWMGRAVASADTDARVAAVRDAIARIEREPNEVPSNI